MAGAVSGLSWAHPEEEGEPDEWVPLASGREEEEDVPLRGSMMLGHGPSSELGRKGFPRPFLIFSFSFSFPFSILSFLSHLLQI
jgi:hypothetical protein